MPEVAFCNPWFNLLVNNSYAIAIGIFSVKRAIANNSNNSFSQCKPEIDEACNLRIKFEGSFFSLQGRSPGQFKELCLE